MLIDLKEIRALMFKVFKSIYICESTNRFIYLFIYLFMNTFTLIFDSKEVQS